MPNVPRYGHEAIYDPSEKLLQIDTLGGRSFIHLALGKFPGGSLANPLQGFMKWSQRRWQGADVCWGGGMPASACAQIDQGWLGESAPAA